MTHGGWIRSAEFVLDSQVRRGQSAEMSSEPPRKSGFYEQVTDVKLFLILSFPS